MTGDDLKTSTLSEDLEDLYENAPCSYISLDPDGVIVKVNRTFSKWMGAPADQLTGRRLRDLFTVAGRMFYETHFAPLLRMQGQFEEVALDLVAVDGTKLAVLVNATEKRDTKGNLLVTRVALFQATERRSYERELVEARTLMRSKLDLEQENSELREQFIAVLGHDLRNPLASIEAALRMLRPEVQTAKAIGILDLAQGSIFRMSNMIDNILDLARGRLGGGIVLEREANQPLEPILRQVVDELRSSHPDHTVEISIDLPQPVNCDPQRIGQLASNLLGNAFNHGAQDKPLRMGAIVEDGVFNLWVANNGTPISNEAKERLFQPFFRGDVRPNQQGLGLGLYIASEIARAHEGYISVRSDAEETRFTFVMPLI